MVEMRPRETIEFDDTLPYPDPVEVIVSQNLQYPMREEDNA